MDLITKQQIGIASTRRLSGLALVLLLTACGGGGGGSNANSTVDISGVAAKGLIKSGVVNAYAVNADGTKSGTALASTTTNTEGSYTLKGLPADMPVVVEVTANANTRVVDENTGSDYAPANGFSLAAAINTVAGGTNTANVTPFSHMAVTRAKASTGGLSTANIESANTYVAEATGVKINSSDSTPKFDVDGKTPKNDAAVKLVAVAKMTATADTSVNGCTGDVAAKAKCVVEKMATEATDALDASQGITRTLKDKVAEVKASVSSIAVSDVKTPTNSGSGSTTSPIEQARAFFNGLLSNAKALKDTSGGTDPTLYTKLKEIQTDLNTRASPLNKYAQNMITLISKAHGLLEDAKGGSGVYSMYWYRSSYTYTDINGKTQSYGYDPIGGCGIYQDADISVKATSAGTANHVSCTTAPNALNYYPPVGNESQQTVTGLKLVPSASTLNVYTVYSRTFRRIGTQSSGGYTEDIGKRQYLSAADANGNGYQANVTLTKNSNQAITAIAWSGDMASSYDDAGAVLGKKHVVHLNVSVNGLDTHTQKLAMTGDISLVNGSDELISKLSLDTGSHVIVSDNKNGQDAMSMQFTLSVPRWVISGQLIGTAYVIDKSGLYAPTNVEFSGSVKDSGIEFFKGSITGVISNYANYDSSKPEAADNFTPATTQVKGTVSIPNRPTLSVTMSGNSSAYGVGSASLVYTQATDPSVTLTASRTADRPTIKNYTFNNSQGIAMRWNSTDTQADLTKNDVTLGTWNFNTGRLTFTNGQFVQF